MATIEEITDKYNQLMAELHNEFYETINKVRQLKPDKDVDELNQRFHQLEQDSIDELATIGIVEQEPEPVRDLAAEIDELKAKVEALETKVATK